MITSYLKWPGNNFGDKLNDIIFQSLGIEQCIPYKKPNLFDLKEDTALGLGTLLSHKVKSPVTVLGSGADGVRKPTIPLNYKFVRGKLTAHYLNLDPSLAVGDTAYFLKEYIQNFQTEYKEYEIGIIPHYVNNTVLQGDNIISPTLPIDEFIIKVSKCKVILAEAMHGAICADILRIPWAPISIDPVRYPIQYFKWNDFASMFNLDLEFGTTKTYKKYLSGDNILDTVSDNVHSQLLAVVNK